MVTSLVAFMMMIALGRVCLASTLFTDITLIPASDGLAFNDHSANLIMVSDHTVFFERLGEPDPYVDQIRIVGKSIDVDSLWSFAGGGSNYNAPSGLDGQRIPEFWAGIDPPVPGAPVPSETFYLAFTIYDDSVASYSFGWVQLQLMSPLRSLFNADGSADIVLLGGAYTNDPRGIVVGEYRVVPEPTSGVLAGFTASLFAAIALLKRKRYPAC